MKSLLLVFIGGGLGSTVRYLMGKWINTWHQFPLNTLTINIIACFLLGFIVGLADHRQVISPFTRLFWAVGFCGGFSTFSTFSFETLKLIQNGLSGTMLLYIALSLLLCLAATFGGLYLGQHS